MVRRVNDEYRWGAFLNARPQVIRLGWLASLRSAKQRCSEHASRGPAVTPPSPPPVTKARCAACAMVLPFACFRRRKSGRSDCCLNCTAQGRRAPVVPPRCTSCGGPLPGRGRRKKICQGCAKQAKVAKRRCPACLRDQPIKLFRRKRRADGQHPDCRECRGRARNATRTCSACGRTLPQKQFRHQRLADGLHVRCRDCRRRPKVMRRSPLPPTPAGIKACGKCLKTKSVSDFGRNKCKKDGLTDWCRGCTNAYFRDYYAARKRQEAELHARHGAG